MPNLPLVVAALLRESVGDAEDAQVLIDRGSLRNGAKLARSAFELLLQAVAATEQRKPPAGQARPEQVPAGNPLRDSLMQASRLADAGGDGAGILRADVLLRSLKTMMAAQRQAAEAFDVDLQGSGPAGNVRPIRPPPPPPSPEPVSRQEPPPFTSADRPRIVGARPTRPEARKQPAASGVVTGAGIVAAGRAEKSPSPAHPHFPRLVDHREKQSARSPPSSPRQGSAAVPGRTARSGPPQAGTAAPAPREMPSTAFWSLVDRWRLPDLDALRLIGHPGGLSSKGTRPRFRVKGQEAELLMLLREIEDRLNVLGENPGAWMKRALAADPFGGASPIERISRNGERGARDVLRYITQLSLAAT